MTTTTEIESLTDDLRSWRLRCYAALAVVVVLVISLFSGNSVANEAVVACGVACGPGRLKMAKRAICECVEAK